MIELPGLKTTKREWLMMIPSWATSLIFHALVLLALALLVLPREEEPPRDLLASTVARQRIEEFETVEIERQIDLSEPTELSPEIQSDSLASSVETVENVDNDLASIDVELSDSLFETAPRADLMSEVGSYRGSGLEGRAAGARRVLVAQNGGSIETEAAVERALHWLMRHQNPDGGWSFDHTKGQCQGRCDHPGLLRRCTTGATGLALLPFLGAGQTHREGTYRKNIAAGLKYLLSRMKYGPNGGSLLEGGRMYDHGICTIVLCEAYAMTQDPNLARPAQAAVNFIVNAQDTQGGGWRYVPGMPGDTSVVGWQLMALKSAHMAYLRVPPITIEGANHFLNTVQVDGGARYGYVNAGDRSIDNLGTTSVGLLCRMYLGWAHDQPALGRGIEYLAKRGPAIGRGGRPIDPYYNYYATQVMHHYGGPQWKRWNRVMRDFLVKSQAKSGHEVGSWWFEGPHTEAGGRLYTTALACMTLEVYYRYMPLYRHQSTQSDF